MTQLNESLKNQLRDLAETLNAFKSEAVQVKVADKLLDAIFLEEQNNSADDQDNFPSRKAKRINPEKGEHTFSTRERKSTGATKAMHQLLDTDFFDQPKSISAVAHRYNQEFNLDFKTSEISGILLKTVKENILKREKNQENKRYEYVKKNLALNQVE